jgi:hypothetical protein
MKKLLIIPAAAIALAACGDEVGHLPDGSLSNTCRGHGGVHSISHDATNSKLPVVCNDGYVWKLDM